MNSNSSKKTIKIDKEKAHKFLVEKVQKELDGIKSAYKTTKSMTSEEDMQSESKWDTRSIEAGYLAGAQKARVEELEQELKLLEDSKVEVNSENQVQIGSIIELEFANKKMFYYLLATCGGEIFEVDGVTLLTTTVFSPLGDEMLGLKVGEDFEVETPKETRTYTIKSII